MGAIGGGIFHVIRGSWNAPKNSRLTGAINASTARGPILGGQFAVWGGMFACCDCTLTAIRQKEDPWNSIASGAITGGVLALRAGPKAATQAAAFGGVILALIEGMGIMLTKMMAPPMPTPEDMAAMGSPDPLAPPTTGGMGVSTMPYSDLSEQPSSLQSNESDSSFDPFAILSGSRATNSESFQNDTKFSTESSSTESFVSSSNKSIESKSSWWPFD